MPYVVQEPCVNCKYGDCVDVCPVDCFFEADEQLYIHPDECIDCGACLPECPVEAIVTGDDAEPDWLEKNAKFDYTDDKRKTSKDDVTHGPNWDADKA